MTDAPLNGIHNLLPGLLLLEAGEDTDTDKQFIHRFSRTVMSIIRSDRIYQQAEYHRKEKTARAEMRREHLFWRNLLAENNSGHRGEYVVQLAHSRRADNPENHTEEKLHEKKRWAFIDV